MGIFFLFALFFPGDVVKASTLTYSGGGTTYAGFVGDSRTASLTGGILSSTYTFFWSSTATGTTFTLGTCATGTGTSCSLAFNAPATNKGDWFIHAQIQPLALDVSNALTFTVNPKLTTSSPASGFVGTSVSVSGTGFASESITVQLGTFSLGTTTPSSGIGGAAGNMSVTANASEMPKNSYAVHATGTTSGDVVSAFTFVMNPKIVLSSISGTAGSSTNVSGNGFAASSTITVTIDGSDTAITATSNSVGTLGSTAYVPSGAVGGHDIGAHDSAANTASTIRYVIIDPIITLSLNSGNVGNSITISGNAFAPSATVTITWDGSDTATTVASNASDGAFSDLSFTIPATVAGSHSISAHDNAAHTASSKTYTVSPKITLSVATGIVGGVPIITGTGFAAISLVTIKWDGSASGPTFTSNSSGGFGNFNFFIPTSVNGNHTIGVSDAASNIASDVTFSITPSVLINSSSGAPGDSLTLSGTGFNASSTVTLWFNNSATSATVTSASNGTMSGIVYAISALQTAGTFNVTAKDAASHTASNVSYQVGTTVTDAFITVSSTRGNVGDTITLTGKSFAVTATSATIRWDGTNTATTCAVSGGNLSSCSFTIPASVAGNHTVSAKDNASVGSKTSLNQSYRVFPKITLSSTTAAAGTAITITGSGFDGSSAVTVTWDNADTSTTATSNATGGFSGLSFTIPGGGSHTVGVRDASRNFADNIIGSFGGGGTLSVDIIDNAGNTVSNPLITFLDALFSWAIQQATGTLGVSTQKIRVTNSTAAPAWTLSLAATSGSAALWSNGSQTYDFNGASSDGRVQVDPGSGTLSPQTGCSSTGVSRGSSAYFSQGSVDSIALLSAGSSADTNCYWDFIGVFLTQDIPAEQPTGNYALNMTLTVQ